jgi:hypothetical protein
MDRPLIFKVGLVALWISIGCQIAATWVIKISYFYGDDIILNMLTFMPLILLAFFAYWIAKCKNWARIVVLVWSIIFILPSGLIKGAPAVLMLLRLASGSAGWQAVISSGLIAVATVLLVFALYVFFTKPSSILFRKGVA